MSSTSSSSWYSGYASPSPRKKGGGGRTSRVIPDNAKNLADRIVDLPFDLFGLRWLRITRGVPRSVKTTPSAYMYAIFGNTAHLVAAGGYGVTYRILVTRRTRPVLMKLVANLTNALYIATPTLGTTVLIKIAASKPEVKSAANVARFIKDNAREASAHVHLWRAPPVKIGGMCPVVVHAKKYVPRFYSFGVDLTHGMAVTVMQYIKNSTPLRKLTRVSPSVFHELEKALGAFYVASVDHSDMHLENILVYDGYKVKIIDYGFAVRLPDKIQKAFVHFYQVPSSSLSLNAAAQNFAMEYSNAIQWKRYDGDLSFYNPSYAALRVVWHHMSAANKEILKKYHENAGQTIACAWKR